MKPRVLTLLTATIIFAGSLWAHHSAAAEYVADLSSWKGVITRFSWMNPHTWVYFEAKNSSGALTKFECEGSAPSGLIGNGWTRTTLKPGDQVTIKGYAAKYRPDGCKVRSVILPDGREMFMGWVEDKPAR